MAKRLGLVPHLYARPIVRGIRDRGTASGGGMFAFVEDQYARLALQLRQGQLDGAFLSPVEFAQNYSQWRLVPGSCVVSRGESASVLLIFNEKVRRLKTVAVNPAFPSEIVLAGIVLKEKYDVAPQFLPQAATAAEGLAKADAVLAVDREALAAGGYSSRIDLVDEWFDLTERSFVHGIWAARQGALSPPEIKALAGSGLSDEAMPELSGAEREYLRRFRYVFDDDASSSLNEFFRMAYYHGMLNDLPDVQLERAEES
jgi:predicted solute-binding protein